MVKLTAEEKIRKARIKLSRKQPFFGFIAMHLTLIEKNDMKMKSAAIDFKGNFYYNSNFINKLSDEELECVLSHEVLHLCLEHLFRLKWRHPQAWNMAADIATNYILVKSGMKLPKNCLEPKEEEITIKTAKGKVVIKNLDKLCAETIYEILWEKLPHVYVKGCGYCGFDEHQHYKGQNGGKYKKNRGKIPNWKQITAEAIAQAKSRGKLPGGIDREFDKVLKGTLDWKQLLYQYVSESRSKESTWRRPSRRSRAIGVYLPSYTRGHKIDVVITVDTSGSISRGDLEEFLGEMLKITRSFREMDATVLVGDAAIHSVVKLENAKPQDILNIKFGGGGGTQHTMFYEWIKNNKKDCRVMVNFTDGFSDIQEISRRLRGNFKSIWVLTKNSCEEKDIPFGRVIKIKRH